MGIDRNGNKIKVGDKVRILRQDIFHLKEIQWEKRTGKIVSIDGFYIYVKPRYKRWEIELYDNEIELINKEIQLNVVKEKDA